MWLQWDVVAGRRTAKTFPEEHVPGRHPCERPPPDEAGHRPIPSLRVERTFASEIRLLEAD